MFVPRSLVIIAAAIAFLGFLARPSSGAGTDARHVVRSGETLWTIAESRYGGDPRAAVWRISERNSLDDGSLVPGTVLLLPP